MKALLIYELVPETVQYYILDLASPLHMLAAKCAGVYGGLADKEKDIIALNNMLENETAFECDHIIAGPFSEVIVCGWMM